MSTATSDEISRNLEGRVRSTRRRRNGSNPVLDRCAGGHLLVDIGCGTGALLEQVRGRYDEVVGVDFIPLARNGSANVHLVRSDLRRGLPLSSGIADMATATEVIEHVANPVQLVREGFRVLRPGGVLMLTTPNVRYARHLFRLAVQGRGPKTSGLNDDQLLWDGGHIHYFTSKDVAALLRDAGFVSVRAEALINSHGFLQPLRRLLSRQAGNPLVREFLTGRLLLSGRKPGEPAA